MNRTPPTKYVLDQAKNGAVPTDVAHLGLMLSKLLPLKDNNKPHAVAPNQLPLLLKALTSISPPDGYKEAFQRWAARTHMYNCAWRRCLQVQAVSAVLCGTGEASPIENGLTLSHTWGMPILAGSTIKGVTRAYASQAYPNQRDALEQLFGTTERSGLVAFLDAWWDPWAAERPLQLDVLTPHYAPYYSGNDAPHGMDGPNPVSFLAVCAKSKFRVVLEGDPSWLDLAHRLVIEALEHHGAGSKTRAGYGRFRYVKGTHMVDEKIARDRQRADRQAKWAAASEGERLSLWLEWSTFDGPDVLTPLGQWALGELPDDMPDVARLRAIPANEPNVKQSLHAALIPHLPTIRRDLGKNRTREKKKQKLRALLQLVGLSETNETIGTDVGRPTPAGTASIYGDKKLYPNKRNRHIKDLIQKRPERRARAAASLVKEYSKRRQYRAEVIEEIVALLREHGFVDEADRLRQEYTTE